MKKFQLASIRGRATRWEQTGQDDGWGCGDRGALLIELDRLRELAYIGQSDLTYKDALKAAKVQRDEAIKRAKAPE